MWDLGGQTGLRPYWRCYYQDTNAVVSVIDSADRERLEIAKQELDLMLQEEELRGAPVLILANKQDLPNAMNELEVSTVQKKESIYSHPYICPFIYHHLHRPSLFFLLSFRFVKDSG